MSNEAKPKTERVNRPGERPDSGPAMPPIKEIVTTDLDALEGCLEVMHARLMAVDGPGSNSVAYSNMGLLTVEMLKKTEAERHKLEEQFSGLIECSRCRESIKFWDVLPICKTCAAKAHDPIEKAEVAPDPSPLIDDLIKRIRFSAYRTAVAFRIFVSFNEEKIEWDYKNPDQLKADGVSYRNLRGEPIQ